MTKIYRVRDKATGKYWNGEVHCPTFSENGTSWKTKDKLERSIGWLISYRSTFNAPLPSGVPNFWEIVEIELKEVEAATSPVEDFMKFTALKAEVEKISTKAANFMDVMRKKGVLDKIEFLFVLKPTQGRTYITPERTQEARAHLRQLGVKTRTFREHQGVFGMMDRQQALKARLVLDVDNVIDLKDLRV